MEIGSHEIQDKMPDNGSDGGNSPGFSIGETPRKRGRPPGSKNQGTPISTGVPTKSRTPSAPNLDQMEQAKFIGVGFVALVELVESMVHSNCSKKIEKKLPEKLMEFRRMCEEYGLKEKEKDLMQDAAQRIAVRHEIITKYAPELVLGVTLAQYSVRQMSLIKMVDNMTKEPEKILTTDKPAQAAA